MLWQSLANINESASPCGKDNSFVMDENHPIPGRLASSGQDGRRNELCEKIYSEPSS